MEIVIIILLLLGSLLMLLGAIGLVRFPDIFMRMHAGTKAPSLGSMLMLIASALYFGTLSIFIEVLIIIAIIFITTPVGSHAIGTTAHRLKLKKWERMKIDDLERDENM
ncbi:monovalent cation/H(+) antiporter subunit G [Prolixibacteraceae bacterium Z1-6]|uniref:Monovalent cation/H(+) antiporter subunit G n=1 Tax=Draconibacterium aestuarii TaxID=2998507 RepID=A0A9X3F4L6_9BACT|nr:monovalent cation/H(+) antiporter subunit G [Prolixibacteraceae bacterium Z1-6]